MTFLTFSTKSGGKSPALARKVREHLAESFGPEWGARVDALGKMRAKLRSQGLAPATVSEKVRSLVAEKGWL